MVSVDAGVLGAVWVAAEPTNDLNMTHSEQRIKPNVHPEGDVHQGKFSAIPHPLPEDHHARPQFKPIPDTGWKGQPSVPSQSGGSDEVDFLNKPPYFWKSEGDKFQAKYVT